jgi:hypothetical protein
MMLGVLGMLFRWMEDGGHEGMTTRGHGDQRPATKQTARETPRKRGGGPRPEYEWWSRCLFACLLVQTEFTRAVLEAVMILFRVAAVARGWSAAPETPESARNVLGAAGQ